MNHSASPRPFWNDGGPLLVLPEAAVPEWEGSDPPTGGRVVVAEFRAGDPNAPATDYDRASDLSAHSATTLDVGGSWGVVLGTAPAQSALWVPSDRPGEFYLVGIEAADDDRPARLRDLAAAQPDQSWRSLLSLAIVGPNGLLLAHAACRFTDVRELPALEASGPDDAPAALIGDGLRYPAPAGTYVVSTCDVHTADGEYLTFVRFALSVTAA